MSWYFVWVCLCDHYTIGLHFIVVILSVREGEREGVREREREREREGEREREILLDMIPLLLIQYHMFWPQLKGVFQ